jgi:hypothetical protein
MAGPDRSVAVAVCPFLTAVVLARQPEIRRLESPLFADDPTRCIGIVPDRWTRAHAESTASPTERWWFRA